MDQEMNDLDVGESNTNEIQEVNEVIASKPVEKEIQPEIVEISRDHIINHLKPQENKYWRFSFKNESNTTRLKTLLQSIPEYNLTVDFETPQNKPDIVLKQDGIIVGKINLLLCDRRDANLPEKYYCKLYFYHFKNPQLYEAVKAAAVNFFENFKGDVSGGKRKTHKKHKKRRITYKKKTIKRTYSKRK